MKTKRHSLSFACVLVAFFAQVVWGQQAISVNHSSGPRSPATVTFSFRDASVDYTAFASDDGEGHYYIQVPAENVPSYKISNAPGLKLMVDNEKTDEGHLVFLIPVQPGTVPRLERKNANLVLTFLPPWPPTTLAAQPRPTDANPPTAGLSSARATVGGPSSLPGTPTLAPVSKSMVDDQPVTLSDADLAPPESPGFTVLGLTPQTVVRPMSPRAFASSLLSGVDQNGNFQSGVALDTAPYLVFAGPALTLKKYNESYPTRFLARTQFSFATTKGASDDDKATRLALGLRMTLWDAGDPHADSVLIKCFVDNLRLPPPPTQIDPNNPTLSAADQEMRTKFIADNIQAADTCREDGRKRNWNTSSWT